jgi:ClpP class serine protease
MDFINIIWVIFLFASFAPMVRQRMLDASRLRLMRKIEEDRSSRVIALIHRQESLSLLGFPLARYIDIQDSEELLRAIKLTDNKIPIDIILHTPGGLVLASEQIASALAKRKGKVTVFVPHYAMSGGTMIALAADEVVMDDNAVLGPVDPQVGNYPAVSVLKVLEDKPAKDIDDETMILADVSRKALAQVKNTIRRIACCQYSEEIAEQLAEKLASGQWTHDYPISFEEAKELGIKVSNKMPEDVYKLMNLYPQARARRPSVEFIPLPYEKRPSAPKEVGKGDGK